MTTTAASVTPGRCHRCTGRMIKQGGLDGVVWHCLACGAERAIGPDDHGRHPSVGTQEANVDQTTAGAPSGSNWVTQARQRLGQVIAEVQLVERKKAEAERIQAALIAYGESLPPLPWTRAATKRTTARPSSTRTETCRRCGHTGPWQSFRTVDGELICRKSSVCEARRAARAGEES